MAIESGDTTIETILRAAETAELLVIEHEGYPMPLIPFKGQLLYTEMPTSMHAFPYKPRIGHEINQVQRASLAITSILSSIYDNNMHTFSVSNKERIGIDDWLAYLSETISLTHGRTDSTVTLVIGNAASFPAEILEPVLEILSSKRIKLVMYTNEDIKGLNIPPGRLARGDIATFNLGRKRS